MFSKQDKHKNVKSYLWLKMVSKTFIPMYSVKHNMWKYVNAEVVDVTIFFVYSGCSQEHEDRV